METKNIAAALSKAQAKITGAVKDSNNPFFKSKYADLSSVMEAIREPFVSNELSYTQGCVLSGTSWVLDTIIMHSSGERIMFSYPIICAKQNDPQAFGAAVTYARRFSLSAISGVASVDDDGNIAAGKTEVENGSQKVTAPTINENQRKKLFATCREHGWAEADLKAHLESMSVSSSKDLTVKQYDDVLAYVKKNVKSAPAEAVQQ